MKYQLMGFKVKKGEFVNQSTGQIVQYDNIEFHVAAVIKEENTYGATSYVMKIKRAYVEQDIPTLKSYIGKNVRFDTMPNGNRIEYCGIDVID